MAVKKKKRAVSRDDQLAALAEEVNRALGTQGKVYLGRDHQEFERIQTGILALDVITGGGIPRRMYTELYGQESSGKTLIALNACAAVQKQKGVACWIVGEEFDDDWAAKQDVDVDKLIKIEALTGDLMLETAVTYLESGLIDLLVIDSVQALGTARENKAGVESESYAGGGAPQMWGRFYRATRSLYNSRQSNAAIIGISQVREAIGQFSPSGKPEPMPTQIRVLKHWKAISVYCKRGEPTFSDPKSDKKRIISREFKLQCKKNKTSAPERVGSYIFNFQKGHFGIDRADEVFRLARVYDLIEQKGKILEGYGIKVSGSKDAPAAEQYIEKLRKNPTIIRELTTDIIQEVCGE